MSIKLKNNCMKILHVGWGFSPWLRGGMIEYAEDLMEAQAENGHQVFYFFSGRQYPVFRKAKLIKRQRHKVVQYELINSPIVIYSENGSLNPELDLHEPLTQLFFREVIEEVNPDIIHIQEFSGIPTSLIDIAKDEYGLPIVATLHDYSSLCPTIKLFDHLGNNCIEEKIGSKCVVCCQNATSNKSSSIRSSLLFEFESLAKPVFNLTKFSYLFIRKLLMFISLKFRRENTQIYSGSKNTYAIDKDHSLAKSFQNRRDININRLKRINLVIAQSRKVADIYTNFTKSNNVITLHSVVKHIELLTPKVVENVKFPINFATINGCISAQKGANLLLKAIKILSKKGLNEYFNFHIWGGLSKSIEHEISSFNNVFHHGPYNIANLNLILEDIDVGIVPSTWEEVYGYVGIEFLAKGIPVVGNQRGGIVDYTIDNVTGWVNKSSSAEELAEIIVNIIDNPQIITQISRSISSSRSKLVKPFSQHFEEILNIYHAVQEQNLAKVS